jgi:hypothetical protein
MLRERLERDQETAMREKDPVKLRTIRSLRAAIQTQEIANRGSQGRALDEEAVLAILAKQAKQRRDSIEQFRKGGRSDLVSQELAELMVIESYLPSQLSDEEIESSIREIVIDVGATGPSSMGKVMGAAMEKLRGVADGKRVQEIVRKVIGT